MGLLMSLFLVCGLARIASATDGNLADWSDATWINLNVVYSGSGGDLTDAKCAMRWSSTTNLIYVAVTGVDMNHAFIAPTENVGGWDTTDTVEVYIDADKLNKVDYPADWAADPTQSYWKYAQQYCGGLKTDGSVWCALSGKDGWSDGTTTYNTNAISAGMVSFAASVDGDTINYEMAIKPYKILNIGDPSASSMVKLSGGDVIGFDVIMTSYDGSNYVFMAENSVTEKYEYASYFTSYTLVGTDTHNTDLQFVKVGDVNNTADAAPVWGYDKAARGSVSYEYYIGKYEVTVAQYVKFLNEAASTSDAYGLYDSNMQDDAAQITRTANTDGTYIYTVNAGCANRPMEYISWSRTARYANWLTSGDTEVGVVNFYKGYYMPWTYSTDYPIGYNYVLKTSSTPAYWIPTLDEWYKAAYYDSDTQSYYYYPTSSDTTPSGGKFDNANSANWRTSAGVFVIGSPFYATEVGTFENAVSPYGCYDMAGNVSEWTYELVWNDWGDNGQYYGPLYHGGGWYTSESTAMEADDFTCWVINGSANGTYPQFGELYSNSSMGMRICCNQAAIDANTTRIPGDANGDGMVDVGDLGILAANYGKTSGATWAQGDFNGDGAVDVGDLGILAANYGTGTAKAVNFNADYAKVFGTTAEDSATDSTTDDTSSSVCSSLGLSLVAGLMLMGLMLVKVEE
jgi:formylglycine-generating enzyme required for sulfatase activity